MKSLVIWGGDRIYDNKTAPVPLKVMGWNLRGAQCCACKHGWMMPGVSKQHCRDSFSFAFTHISISHAENAHTPARMLQRQQICRRSRWLLLLRKPRNAADVEFSEAFFLHPWWIRFVLTYININDHFNSSDALMRLILLRLQMVWSSFIN